MNALVSLATPSVTPRAADPVAVELSRAIKRAWKSHIQQQPVTADQHAVYALLRGKPLEKTFTPLRRPSKIAGQGGVADRARQEAERAARNLSTHAWAPFADLLKDAPSKPYGYVRQANPLFDRVPA